MTAKTTTRRKTASKKTSARKRSTTTAKTPDLAPEADLEAGAPDTITTDTTATPEPVELPLPNEDHPSLRKKELIELAVARCGVKKRDAKPAIEAALAVLGEALAEGRELNLQPLGKLKVTRMKQAGNGQIINARVRQPKAKLTGPQDDAPTPQTPLAHAAE